MKKKKRSVLALTIVMLVTNLSVAQEESSNKETAEKYTIGIGTGGDDYYNSYVSLNFRKYKKDYNLKAVLIYGLNTISRTTNDNTYSFFTRSVLPTPLSSPDTNGRFTGKDGYSTKKESLKGIRFGIEKEFKLGLVNFISGVDVIIDYYKVSTITRVNNYIINSNYNESNYLNPFYPHYGADEVSNINQLETTSHFLHYGVGFNLGLKLNITKNVFITTMFSYSMFDEQNIKTVNSYENDQYKEELYVGNSDIRSSFRSNISINYRF